MIQLIATSICPWVGETGAGATGASVAGAGAAGASVAGAGATGASVAAGTSVAGAGMVGADTGSVEAEGSPSGLWEPNVSVNWLMVPVNFFSMMLASSLFGLCRLFEEEDCVRCLIDINPHLDEEELGTWLEI